MNPREEPFPHTLHSRGGVGVLVVGIRLARPASATPHAGRLPHSVYDIRKNRDPTVLPVYASHPSNRRGRR